MTPAEAIAALEAAYPPYPVFQFAVCHGRQTIYQRTLSGEISGEISEIPLDVFTVSTFKDGKLLCSCNAGTLEEVTQSAIAQVAAQLEGGK